MGPGLFIVCCILIVLLIIGGSMAAIYQHRVENCKAHPNPWCHFDWNCLDSNGKEMPVEIWKSTGVSTAVGTDQGMLHDCGTISQARADTLNTNGHKNIYSINHPGCSPDSQSTCPPYQAGDIDWTTCVPPKDYDPL